MIETNEAGIREAVERGSALKLAVSTLRVIAVGGWNAGRDQPITVEQYAQETLRVILRERES